MADRIRVLLTEEEVDKRINEVAAKISEDYAGVQVENGALKLQPATE